MDDSREEHADPPPLHTQVEILLTSTSSAGRSWSSFSFIREKHEFGFDPVNVRRAFSSGAGLLWSAQLH